MNATATEPKDVMAREILADAQRQADALLEQARQEAAILLATAAAEAEQVRQVHLAEARASATRLIESARAALPAEIERLRSTRVETLLQSIHDEVRRRLGARQGFDTGDALAGLVAEATRQMPDSPLTVRLSPADRTAHGARLGDVTFVDDPAVTEGGAMILDAEGRRIIDNRLPARLDRLWPELRRRIAKEAGLL